MWGNNTIYYVPNGILVVNKENHIQFVNFTLANVSLNDAGLYNIHGDNDAKPLSVDDQVLFIWGRSRHL